MVAIQSVIRVDFRTFRPDRQALGDATDPGIREVTLYYAKSHRSLSVIPIIDYYRLLPRNWCSWRIRLLPRRHGDG